MIASSRTPSSQEWVDRDTLVSMINKYFAACCALLVMAAAATVASVQTKDPVAGVWERTSNKNLTTGLSPDEPSRPLRVIYLDGYFIQFMAAAGRAKLDPATRSTWTKEQLADRIRMQGQSGTYKVLDNGSISHNIEVAGDPRNEGTEQTFDVRFEGETLILTRTLDNKDKIETRFRRLN
jgi:lipocalin-like protein